jgi:hypothetical protein
VKRRERKGKGGRMGGRKEGSKRIREEGMEGRKGWKGWKGWKGGRDGREEGMASEIANVHVVGKSMRGCKTLRKVKRRERARGRRGGGDSKRKKGGWEGGKEEEEEKVTTKREKGEREEPHLFVCSTTTLSQEMSASS